MAPPDTRRELRLDTPHGPLAATWAAPPSRRHAPVLVGLPGGTYTRAYFDLHVPGRAGYSFVDHALAHGWACLTLDALGTGESARPPHEVGLEEQAASVAHALRALDPAVGGGGPFVAVGHSMGGYLAMVQQATHESYAALAILGTTNHEVAPLGLPTAMIDAAANAAGRDALVAQIASTMPDASIAPDRSPMASWFHLPDVPADVLAADAATATVVPRRAAAQSSVPGITAAAAAAVRVPVLLAYGEVDVSPAPHREPAAFTASDDVTLFVLRTSAHCHNAAGTRAVLWDRVLGWAEHARAAHGLTERRAGPRGHRTPRRTVRQAGSPTLTIFAPGIVPAARHASSSRP